MSSSRTQPDSSSQQGASERLHGAQNRHPPEASINDRDDLERAERENLKRRYWATVRAAKDGADFPKVWSRNDDNSFRGWLFRQKTVMPSTEVKRRLQEKRILLRQRTEALRLSSKDFAQSPMRQWTEVYHVQHLDTTAIDDLLEMDDSGFAEWWRDNALSKVRRTENPMGAEAVPGRSPSLLPPPRQRRSSYVENKHRGGRHARPSDAIRTAKNVPQSREELKELYWTEIRKRNADTFDSGTWDKRMNAAFRLWLSRNGIVPASRDNLSVKGNLRKEVITRAALLKLTHSRRKVITPSKGAADYGIDWLDTSALAQLLVKNDEEFRAWWTTDRLRERQEHSKRQGAEKPEDTPLAERELEAAPGFGRGGAELQVHSPPSMTNESIGLNPLQSGQSAVTTSVPMFPQLTFPDHGVPHSSYDPMLFRRSASPTPFQPSPRQAAERPFSTGDASVRPPDRSEGYSNAPTHQRHPSSPPGDGWLSWLNSSREGSPIPPYSVAKVLKSAAHWRRYRAFRADHIARLKNVQI